MNVRMPGSTPSQIRRVAAHRCSVQLRGQAAKKFSFSIRHFYPVGYNEHGNGNLRVLQPALTFLFYTVLELLMIFTGSPNVFGRVAAKGVSASHWVTSLVSAARRELSSPRLQFQILFPEAFFMARRLLIQLGLFFLFSISARAQSFDLFGGYSYERFGGSPARNLHGVEITGQYKFRSWLGIAADMDAHFGLPSSPDARTLDFMVGPQVSFPARISPFVHLLAGIGHARTNGSSDTSFAGAIGAGIDMRIVPLVSWRILQADEIITHHFGGVQHNARISTGLVFRF
jgi:hypothetical protein